MKIIKHGKVFICSGIWEPEKTSDFLCNYCLPSIHGKFRSLLGIIFTVFIYVYKLYPLD